MHPDRDEDDCAGPTSKSLLSPPELIIIIFARPLAT